MGEDGRHGSIDTLAWELVQWTPVRFETSMAEPCFLSWLCFKAYKYMVGLCLMCMKESLHLHNLRGQDCRVLSLLC